MSVYNLDHLFNPRTIGLLGRYDCRSCQEQVVYQNLRASRGKQVLMINLDGCSGENCWFKNYGPCYASLDAIPEEIDLLIVSGHQFNTSFFETAPVDGQIALISQSGAIISSILDLAAEKGVGFSHVVSLGSLVDVDFGDVIDYLGWEYNVRCILLYIENLHDVKKFLSACRSVSMIKPIVAIKGGKSDLAREVIKKHTSHFAGDDNVYDTALRRAGVIRVETIAELLAAGVSLFPQNPTAGENLGIIANSGGLGVLVVDSLNDK